MKPFCFLTILVLGFGTAGAQTSQLYAIFSSGLGDISIKEPGYHFPVSFPYTSTLSGGNPVSHTFNGTASASYHQEIPVFDLLRMELIRNYHYDLEIGGGLFRDMGNDWSGYFEEAFRYVLSYRNYYIKPGLKLLILFGHKEYLGSIDNRNQQINALGVTSPDQFTVTSGSGDYYTVSTVQTDHLDVSYTRTYGLFGPSVVISTKPLGKRYNLSMELGWYIQIDPDGSLDFVQRDTQSDRHDVGSADWAGQNGVRMGPFLGVSIGFVTKGGR